MSENVNILWFRIGYPLVLSKESVVYPGAQSEQFPSSSLQVWFQNCRARHKKYIGPSPAAATVMTSLPSGQLTPPVMDDLQYTTYISPDAPLLTTFTYMDGKDVKTHQCSSHPMQKKCSEPLFPNCSQFLYLSVKIIFRSSSINI